MLWAGANDYISKEAFDTSISLFLGEPHSEEGYRNVVSKVVDALEQNLERLQKLADLIIADEDLPDGAEAEQAQHLLGDGTSMGLLSQSARFLLEPDEARKTIDEMEQIVKNNWYDIARREGVTEKDCERIASAFAYPGFRLAIPAR